MLSFVYCAGLGCVWRDDFADRQFCAVFCGRDGLELLQLLFLGVRRLCQCAVRWFGRVRVILRQAAFGVSTVFGGFQRANKKDGNCSVLFVCCAPRLFAGHVFYFDIEEECLVAADGA